MQACWSANGAHVIAGRRNGTIEVFDVRKFGPGSGFGQPKILRVLKNPQSSGPVSCVAAFPDKQHLVW
jgi:transcriptional activator SPT8